MKCRNLLLCPTLLLGGFFGAANNANAWSFYWSKVEVQTSSWQKCMTIAFGVSKKQNLANDGKVLSSRVGMKDPHSRDLSKTD